MRTIRLACLMSVVLLSGSFTIVNGQGRGRGGGGGGAQDSGGTSINVSVGFGSGEIRLIRSWFGDSQNLQGLPPGLAKRETLPPGLQRQLQKNGTLPPGLQDHIYAVPVDLNHRLPTLQSGVSRFIVGGSIVLMDDSSKVILDIAAIF